MVRLFKTLLLAGVCTASLAGCSSGGSGSGGGGGATTYSISGTMSIGAGTLGIMSIATPENYLPFAGAACSNGKYYQVYCVSFSSPPVSAEGNVSCSGSTGGFTVAGLPVDTAIGCFVRQSTNGSDYSTLGTLEIPSTGLGGTTSAISSNGDLGMNIAIDSSGTITAEVVSGEVDTDSGSSTDTSLTGIYKIYCNPTADGVVYKEEDVIGCKCRNFDHQNHASYKSGGTKNPAMGGTDPETACMNDDAADITAADSTQYVDFTIYNATVNSDVMDGDKKILEAGTTAQAVAVWKASDATTSLRGAGGGDSAPTFGGALTWANAQATTAISWTTGNLVCRDEMGANYTITTAAPPSNTANVGAWHSWLATAANDADFTCNWGNNGSKTTDANCLSELANQCYGGSDGQSARVPRVNIERNCTGSGCDATVANSRVYVEGLDFNYSNTWSGSQAAVTPGGGMGAEPSVRYVFEKWNAFPSGGGTFTQKQHHNRWFQCDDVAGRQVESALCNGTDDFDYLQCSGREEMQISLIPTGTSGTYNLVFASHTVVFWSKLTKFSGGAMSEVQSSTVHSLCENAMNAYGSNQLMTAEKQP